MGKSELKSSVIAFRTDRMGSRFIAILNAFRFAKDYDLPCKIYWLITEDISEEIKHPEDIFSQSFMDEHFISKEEFEATEPKCTEVAYKNPTWTKARIDAEKAAGRSFLMSHAFASIAVFDQEDHETIKASVADAFDQISFNPVVAEMMARIDKITQAAPPIAYHIRRGDIIDPTTNASRKLWPKKYTPREFYAIYLRRFTERSDGKLIVFSDEPREIEKLREISDNVLSLDDMVDTEALNQAQYDFLSLYAMSRCKEIIGSPGSGFSETAALIGNGKVIDVTTALSDDDQAEALELLSKNLADGPENFLGLADVGQTLPFAQTHWQKHGRTKEGAEILEKYLALGLNRSYLFVILCELYLDHGNASAALKTRDLARNQGVTFDLAMAELNLICVRANLDLGQDDEAINSLCLALWAFPNIKNGELTALKLRLQGKLSPEKFFPFDAELRRLAIPNSPAAGGTVPGGTPKTKAVIVPLLSLDLITRDWSDFFGKRRHRLFNHKDHVALLYDRIQKIAEKASPEASYKSLCGVYEGELQNHQKAIEHHTQAVELVPDDPLFIKRLAEAHNENGQGILAVSLFEDAYKLSGEHPLYGARLAEAMLKTRNVDEAIELYKTILPKSGNFPEILLKGASALSRRKNSRKQARQYGKIACEESQGSLRVLNAYAGILARCESQKELYEILQAISVDGKLRPKFQEIHKKLARKFS